MNCRHCSAPLTRNFVDLGTAPPSNAYLNAADLGAGEMHLPLRVRVCDGCWLVQTEDFAAAATLFGADYAYFSATSASWLAHARRLVADMVARFNLGAGSVVVEVAANDGYLLQYVAARGIPCYGIEPAAGTAAVARGLGLEILGAFFNHALGRKLAAEGRTADLIVANNVLAHVPDINDFAKGFAALLKPGGVAIFEFPHLLQLIEHAQFDTIYHEHFSYLSLAVVTRIFALAGLTVFDAAELPTHGGSLRVFAALAGSARQVTSAPARIIAAERAAGLCDGAVYDAFQARAEAVKNGFLGTLLSMRANGLGVAAYGAAAKGNTLLNFAGVRGDLIEFVVDRSPGKVGRYMPGSRIPIVAEDVLRQRRPDRIVILPWNIAGEIARQLEYTRDWGARFMTAVPEIREF
ncbi:class I SAM-dependent methyltransferase [Acuticoccus sp. MNP-M23]|uniref:class I SAM-dependent methyltransferase n=1 Tax=Acuticoccus sp. MNP-M23 TaxID=3072793 RepID=UPI0028156208|nr:class I SAM-dependent methyltransferase [Acuticoccus sp. MNP-M23]WMS43026.1 class I SAM-dependent methyltransferase [Acuticoccus sp. MNP-M23]